MSQIAVALARIFQHLQQGYAPTRVPAPVGLPAAEVTTRLTDFPCALPQEVYTLYECYNGVPSPSSPPYPYEHEFLPGWDFLPLETALATYQQEMQEARSSTSSGVWQAAWWPLFRVDFNYYVVWCPASPQPTAPVYEVIRTKGDDDDVQMAYDSVTSLLHTVATCYDTGAYWINERDVVDYDERREAEILRRYNPQRTAWWLAQAEVDTVVDLVACLTQDSVPTPLVPLPRWWPTLQALQHLLDPQTVVPLLQFLQSKPLGARSQAMELLGDLGDPRAVEPLITVLGDADDRFRAAAARALGHLADPRAVAPLIQALDDPEEVVRQEAVKALGHLGDTRAGAPLFQVFSMRPQANDHLMRLYETLGAVRATEAVPLLLQVVREDHPIMQGIAVTALGRIGDPRAVDVLTDVLRQCTVEVRRKAAVALGQLGTRAALEPLTTALRSDPDDRVRTEAARALGQFPLEEPQTSPTVPALLHALRDPDRTVRRHAARTLVQLHIPHTHTGLRQMLDDPEAEVRQHVTWVLEALRRAER